MANLKREAPMSRMSIYISEANRRRLAAVPRGEKTELVNKALDEALSEIERLKNFDAFLDMVRNFPRIKTDRSSEDMLRELRETGDIKR